MSFKFELLLKLPPPPRPRNHSELSLTTQVANPTDDDQSHGKRFGF